MFCLKNCSAEHPQEWVQGSKPCWDAKFMILTLGPVSVTRGWDFLFPLGRKWDSCGLFQWKCRTFVNFVQLIDDVIFGCHSSGRTSRCSLLPQSGSLVNRRLPLRPEFRREIQIRQPVPRYCTDRPSSVTRGICNSKQPQMNAAWIRQIFHPSTNQRLLCYGSFQIDWSHKFSALCAKKNGLDQSHMCVQNTVGALCTETKRNSKRLPHPLPPECSPETLCPGKVHPATVWWLCCVLDELLWQIVISFSARLCLVQSASAIKVKILRFAKLFLHWTSSFEGPELPSRNSTQSWGNGKRGPCRRVFDRNQLELCRFCFPSPQERLRSFTCSSESNRSRGSCEHFWRDPRTRWCPTGLLSAEKFHWTYITVFSFVKMWQVSLRCQFHSSGICRHGTFPKKCQQQKKKNKTRMSPTLNSRKFQNWYIHATTNQVHWGWLLWLWWCPGKTQTAQAEVCFRDGTAAELAQTLLSSTMPQPSDTIP